MKKLAQRLKNGEIQVVEVPSPVLGPGKVLVRNHCSLMIIRTEGHTMAVAKKSLMVKARVRLSQLKQVVQVVKQLRLLCEIE